MNTVINSCTFPLVEKPNVLSATSLKWFRIIIGIYALLISGYFSCQSIFNETPLNGPIIFNTIILPLSLLVISLATQQSYIKFDGETLRYKTNYFSPTKVILFTDIKSITVDFTDVKIISKQGTNYHIDLAATKHSNIALIKSELKAIKITR